MRVFLIFHLLISAAICASLVQQLDGESNFKERPSPVGPEKQNRWSSQVEDLDECTNLTYNNPDGGRISSPNYPGNYPYNLSCSYLIDLRTSAESVSLQFLDVNTQEGWDLVKVYDGPSVNDLLLYTASGSANPGSILSNTGQMLVTFTTNDYALTYRGFLAQYSNGDVCGKTFTEMTGNITSTNYPRDYFNNLNCEYLIDLRSSGASSVTLTFNDFKTENGFDNVYVYEGLTTGVLLFNVSGSETPAPVVSTTAQMLVRFTTDSSYVYRGFSATYVGV